MSYFSHILNLYLKEIDTLPKIKLFIAITSSAVDYRSQKSRNEIRKTWMTLADKLSNVDMKFFLGQPPEGPLL